MDVNKMRAAEVVSSPRVEPVAQPKQPTRTKEVRTNTTPAPQPKEVAAVPAHQPPVTEVVHQGVDEAPRVAPQVNITDVTDEALQRAALEANRALMLHNVRLQYQTHEATGLISVTVIDADTDEVIREIPGQRRLDAMYQFRNIEGLFTSLEL